MDVSSSVFDSSNESWEERLAFVTRLMTEMSQKTDVEEMVRWYARQLQGQVLERYLSITRRGVEEPWVILARDSSWAKQPDVWRDRDSLPRFDRGLFSDVAYSGEVFISQDLKLDPDDPAAEVLSDVRSVLAVPIFDGGESLNVSINVDHRPNRVPLHAVPYIVWMTNLFARATHNLNLARRLDEAHRELDREMELIGAIQRDLQPGALPEVPGLEVRAFYEPATQAGGDYYDVIPFGDEERWGIVIADVSGHGAPAAVEMAMLRTLVHEAAHRRLAPGKAMRFVNSRMTERRNTHGAFVTAFLGSWDPETARLDYAIAGHPRPVLRRDGELVTVDDDASGPPLGVLPGVEYGQNAVWLKPGDRLILYTDGVTEAASPTGAMLGEEGLHEIVLGCDCPASEAKYQIANGVEQHRGGRPPGDDVTIMVLDR
ncbi:MAG: PP2C family protein-serine/threonine phosphatase [Planctomycetota bacterium]